MVDLGLHGNITTEDVDYALADIEAESYTLRVDLLGGLQEAKQLE